MMWSIARFEVRKGFWRISTYVYFLLFLLITFLQVIAAGGAFPGVYVDFGGSGGKTMVNSPFVLMALVSMSSCFGLVVMAAVMGQAVYQDFHHQTHTLFFTTPISKLSYLGGRFLGSMLVLCFIFSSLGVGAFLGSIMPFIEPSVFGPQRAYAYVQPFLISVIPNMLFIGATFLSLAALARRMLPVYVASVILLIGYLIAMNFTQEIEWKLAAALADPFGISAFNYVTEYWTVAERNANYIPLRGALLANRVIWLSVAAAIFSGTLWLFRFEQGSHRARSAASSKTLPLSAGAGPLPVMPSPVFQPLRLLPSSVFLNFKETVKNVYFAVIVLAGVLFMVVASQNLGSLFGTETYPVTALVVEIAGGSFSMFLLIIVTFYAGELVWRERDVNMDQLYDVLPVPNWFPLASKILALAAVQAVLMAVVMLCGMGIQISQQYYHFEIGVYLRDLFGFKLIQFVLLSVLAITVHVVVNHKYVGHFVMVLYYLMTAFMGSFGFEHHLYDYAGTPSFTYSDMNRFGHFVNGVLWFDLYWVFAAILLALLSNLFWVRGTDPALSSRFTAARSRLCLPVIVTLALTSVAFVGTGTFIYYNTNVLNKYRTNFQRQEESAEYEKKWKQLEWIGQPRVTDVQVAFDLFPRDRNLTTKGRLVLRNKTSAPIPTVYVNVRPEATIRRLSVGDIQQPSESNAVLGFYTFALAQPLPPDASLSLVFDLAYEARGFRNDASDTQVVYNGTFVNSQSLPHIGYDSSRELADDSVRRKHGLTPRDRMADVHDLRARGNNYISHDADWVTLDATVSTSPDQIAIVPGYLQKEWTEAGRRFFHYRTEGQILHFFSMLSARYEVRRDSWRGNVAFGRSVPDAAADKGVGPKAAANEVFASDAFVGTDQDVSIEIYYHLGHEYNVDRMIEAIKASLDYFTANFSPYQHRQVRIIEFPRYASFAQSFPNTIPYSESIGFIARVDPNDPDDIDYPYYITAHEIAHQWWAHQVIGGNVRGSTLMSETFAQYSALMVMKQKYGADQMKRFLRYELDRYLLGRGIERKKELPLAFNENQGYIHYNKGSLVMYALQDYLGEDVVNRSLASTIRKVGYQDPPYTNSLEFIDELRNVTPSEMQYLIEDMFETITLFDNRAVSARYAEPAPGTYEVTFEVQAKKMRADEQGVETDLSLDDLIDIGVLDAQGRPLVLERKRIQNSSATFTFTVKQLPAKAGIDPFNKLIDRRPGDNVVRVEKE